PAGDCTVYPFDSNTTTFTAHRGRLSSPTRRSSDLITVDVVADVVTNIQNEGGIYNEIINILQDETDIFTDIGDGTFTHTAVDGTDRNSTRLNSTHAKNACAVYTFTNDNGESITVDV